MVRHPTGGVVGKVSSAADGVDIIDTRFPLQSDSSVHTPPDVVKLLQGLEKHPQRFLSLIQALPDIARRVLGPWEMSPAFEGSLIREITVPRGIIAIVAEGYKISELPGGIRGPSRPGTWMYRVWDMRDHMWLLGNAEGPQEAMNKANTLFQDRGLVLVPGRPTTSRWRRGGKSRHVRKLWIPGKRYDGREIAAVWKTEDGWRYRVFVTRSGEGRSWTARSFQEAKRVVDGKLIQEGWFLR